MIDQYIHGRYRTASASLLLGALGSSLTAIKEEDSATDADLGADLGKSEDRVAAYRRGEADMGVVSFLRGCRAWDGRFANGVLAHVGMKLVPIEAGDACDQVAVTTFLRLTMELSADLEEDNDISDDDLAENAALIERVGHMVDGYRERLRRRSQRLLQPPDTS